MSTKTLHPPPRRVAQASTSTTNNNNNISKRKEIDHDTFKRPATIPTTPNTKLFKSDKQIVRPKLTHKESKPKICCSNNGSDSKSNNKLFAGYMAHEFLTKGTLLGQQVDLMPNLGAESMQEKSNWYMEVTHLLKTDEVHLCHIVNPTQLGSWAGS
jgi:hypothetical protein